MVGEMRKQKAIPDKPFSIWNEDGMRVLKQHLLDGKRDLDFIATHLPGNKIFELFKERTDGVPILFLAIAEKPDAFVDKLIAIARKELLPEEQRYVLYDRGFNGQKLVDYAIESGKEHVSNTFVEWESEFSILGKTNFPTRR